MHSALDLYNIWNSPVSCAILLLYVKIERMHDDDETVPPLASRAPVLPQS